MPPSEILDYRPPAAQNKAYCLRGIIRQLFNFQLQNQHPANLPAIKYVF